MVGHWAFCVNGPVACNSLPDSVWDPAHSPGCFQRISKLLLASYRHTQHIRGLAIIALYKSTIDTDIDSGGAQC